MFSILTVYLCVLWLLFQVEAQIDRATVTITDYPEWTYLHTCVRRILSEDDWLRGTLKCPYPWYEDCKTILDRFGGMRSD